MSMKSNILVGLVGAIFALATPAKAETAIVTESKPYVQHQ